MSKKKINYSFCEEYLIEELGYKTLVMACKDHDKIIKKSVSDISLAIGDIVENSDENFKIDEGGCIYIFNGTYYDGITPDEFKIFLNRVLRRLFPNSSGLAMYAEHHSKFFMEQAIDRLMGSYSCRYEPDRSYIIFNNGVFSLEKGVLVEPDKKICTDIVIDFDYDPTAKSVLFNKFFNEIMPSDEMQHVIFQTMGACFVNRREVDLQYCFYWLGTGSNGKSVLADLFIATLGRDNAEVFSMEDLFKSSTKAYNIAKCDGAIVNVCSDASKTDTSGGDYKKFVGGEEMPARYPYGKPFKATRIPLLFVLANAMPITTDSTEGHHRRTLPFMFGVTITEDKQDRQLKDKILKDNGRAALFNLIYRGYTQLKANKYKFDKALEISELQSIIRMDTNSVSRWIRDRRYAPDNKNGEKMIAKELLEDYRKYCNEDERMPPNSPKAFYSELQSLGFTRKRVSYGHVYKIKVLDRGIGQEPETLDEEYAEMLAVSSSVNEEDMPF